MANQLANDIPLLPRLANLPVLSSQEEAWNALVRDKLDTDLRMVNHLS